MEALDGHTPDTDLDRFRTFPRPGILELGYLLAAHRPEGRSSHRAIARYTGAREVRHQRETDPETRPLTATEIRSPCRGRRGSEACRRRDDRGPQAIAGK